MIMIVTRREESKEREREGEGERGEGDGKLTPINLNDITDGFSTERTVIQLFGASKTGAGVSTRHQQTIHLLLVADLT